MADPLPIQQEVQENYVCPIDNQCCTLLTIGNVTDGFGFNFQFFINGTPITGLILYTAGFLAGDIQNEIDNDPSLTYQNWVALDPTKNKITVINKVPNPSPQFTVEICTGSSPLPPDAKGELYFQF